MSNVQSCQMSNHSFILFRPARLDPVAHGVLPDLRPAVRRVPDLHHLRHQPGAALEQTKGGDGGGGRPEDAGEAGRLSLDPLFPADCVAPKNSKE